MLIVRTPFRISFFGGGTDYPVWYKENPGAVISSSIDKYCYVTCRYLPPFFDHKYRIRYYLKEEVEKVDDIKHPAVRECLKFMKIEDGIEVVHNADLPAQSGLGSSSTFTVCMLHALYTLKNTMPTKRDLALNAIDIEQNWIKEAVGSQDQTIAAFGGLNRIDFGGPQHIKVSPIILSDEKVMNFNQHLMLFFTGFARNAHDLAQKQIAATPKKKPELHRMLELVEHASDLFAHEQVCTDEIGKLLHEQWMLKRSMTKVISSKKIDDIYETGRKAGAIGGKLLGAGGGGFILFYAKPAIQDKVKEALKDLLYVPFYFEHLGSQVIYYSHHHP